MCDTLTFRDFFGAVFEYLNFKEYVMLMHTSRALREIGRDMAGRMLFENDAGLNIKRCALKGGGRVIHKLGVRVKNIRTNGTCCDGLFIEYYRRNDECAVYLDSIGFFTYGTPTNVLYTYKCGTEVWHHSRRDVDTLMKECLRDPICMFLPSSQRRELECLSTTLRFLLEENNNTYT